MASRVNMGYTVVPLRVGKKILPANTPITVARTSKKWIITVILGEDEGLRFTMNPISAERCIEIVM